MTDYTGSVVGAAKAAVPPQLVSRAREGGVNHILCRDTIELASGVAQNDRVKLGDFKSDVVIDPVSSVIWFDDLGTSITMDVGSDATENALVAAQDVATAAGSCSLLKSVDVAKYGQPLWQQLGLSADPGGTIALYAKLEGGDPGTGTLTWQVIGSW